MKFSEHLRNDRSGRIAFIEKTVGFGRIVKELYRIKNNRAEWCCITDTGVMVIKNANKSKIVTMWIATLGQLEQVYLDEVIPKNLYTVVKNNRIYQAPQRALN